MIKIREQVFETNSSSVHSISVSNRKNYDYKIKMEYPYDEYEIKLGRFGWGIDYYGIDYYDDAITKLQYALTMVYETEVCETANILTIKEEFYDTKGYKEIAELLKEKCGIRNLTVTGFEDCYIDHQSCEDYNSLDDFLADCNITLEDFIFNTYVTLHISNDFDFL